MSPYGSTLSRFICLRVSWVSHTNGPLLKAGSVSMQQEDAVGPGKQGPGMAGWSLAGVERQASQVWVEAQD